MDARGEEPDPGARYEHEPTGLPLGLRAEQLTPVDVTVTQPAKPGLWALVFGNGTEVYRDLRWVTKPTQLRVGEFPVFIRTLTVSEAAKNVVARYAEFLANKDDGDTPALAVAMLELADALKTEAMSNVPY